MSLIFDNGIVQLHQADARALPVPDQSVQCVVEKGELREDPQRQGRSVRNVGNLPLGAEAYSPDGGTLGLVRDVETTGWRPTCSCNVDTMPCAVLDPFAGAGTVALVAQKLGRRAVGVDAKAEYLEMAAKRLREVPLPMRMQWCTLASRSRTGMWARP